MGIILLMKEDLKIREIVHFSAGAALDIFVRFGTIGFLSFRTVTGRLRGRGFQDADEFVEPVRDVINFTRPSELDAMFWNREGRLRRCIELCGECVD
jgi:hypothetical protein